MPSAFSRAELRLVLANRRRPAAAGRQPRFVWFSAEKNQRLARQAALLEKGGVLLESTRRSLDQYRPADMRETTFRKRLLGLLDMAEPFSRNHYEPGHLTASAFVLSPARDAVLLIFHRKLGIWIQPGGHIELGDSSLEAAARRELREEVGLDLPSADPVPVFDLDIHGIPARKAEPFHEHFDVRFCFQAPSLDFTASAEVVDARWVELSKIDQLTNDESVLRALRKLRS